MIEFLILFVAELLNFCVYVDHTNLTDHNLFKFIQIQKIPSLINFKLVNKLAVLSKISSNCILEALKSLM